MIIGGIDLQKVNLRERFETFRREWPDRTPKQKWQVLSDIPGTLLRIFGIRVLSDCRIYWLSCFGFFLVFNYSVLAIYTLIWYARAGRFIHGTRCLCGIGIVATVSPNLDGIDRTGGCPKGNFGDMTLDKGVAPLIWTFFWPWTNKSNLGKHL